MRCARWVLVAGTAAALTLAACSGGGSNKNGAATTPTADRTAGSTASPAPQAHEIVVTNDDGVGAPGIDTLVTALRSVPGVHVTVVAPAKNQSGTGGKTTSGTLTYVSAKTASGYPATAVNGYPVDTITVAFDQLHLHPWLVVSGINFGQNLGPLVNISGTVGAAKAAVRRGVPALAVSAGVGSTVDYPTAAKYAIQWVNALLGTSSSAAPSTSTKDLVSNLNVPSCSTGAVRGEKQLPSETEVSKVAQALQKQNCAATATPTTEVDAFNAGFATLTEVPAS